MILPGWGVFALALAALAGTAVLIALGHVPADTWQWLVGILLGGGIYHVASGNTASKAPPA